MDLDYLSLWPLALVTGLAVLIGQWGASLPFYRRLLADQKSTGRANSLDGLRGFLALGVFFTHAASSYIYRLRGETAAWVWPPSRVYVFLGEVPVVFFFMITGYLFWTKAMARKLSWRRHYTNRFARIFPLYWFLAIAALLITGVETGFHLQVGVRQLCTELARLIIPGLRSFDATLNGRPAPDLLTVTWTLYHELCFYLVLPALAFFAARRRFFALLVAAVAIYMLQPKMPLIDRLGFYRGLWIIFVFGMVIAELAPFCKDRIRNGPLVNTLVAIALVGVFCLPVEGAYYLPAYFIVAAVMLALVLGANLFGLFTSPAVRFLGTISYSLYLLHLPCYWVVDHAINRWYPLADWTPEQYWLRVCLACAALIVVSTITYRFIEHPFLAKVKHEPVTIAQ